MDCIDNNDHRHDEAMVCASSFREQIERINTTSLDSTKCRREEIETEERELAMVQYRELSELSDLECVKTEFELAVMEAVQIHQLKLLSSATFQQEQMHEAELEIATLESEIVEASRLEAEERLIKDIKGGFLAITEQDQKYHAELELAIQESEIIEASRLESEEKLKEIEEGLLAELMVLTRIADDEA